MPLSAGTRLGPYEILAPIGAGGMGEVYRARDTRLARDVALKVLPAAFASDPERVRRFEQEAQAAGALNHPNILAVYDAGTQDGMFYVVSELLEGETLRRRLGEAAIPTRKAIEYAIQIAHGLAAAQAKGIVHRDLKPENLFITEDGQVKILDFGLAKKTAMKAANPDAANAATEAMSTQPGVVMGTVGYMSPEQVRGQVVDSRSDIFSLGVILYEMLSGKRAFHRESPVETMNAILTEEPPEPKAPMPLLRILGRCLEKNPAKRFQSANDLEFSLESIRETPASAAGPKGSRTPKRRFWIWAPAGLALVSFFAAAGYWTGIRKAKPSPPLFHQVSFRRGSVLSARFAPDGRSVVFGARWEGSPLELFLTRPDSPESRSLGLPRAEILAVSTTGDMAISLRRRFAAPMIETGTLARVPLGGGAPREILEDVQEADWAPDGSSLAAIVFHAGHSRLEFPIGKVLHETLGWLSNVRVSPNGREVAFMQHPTGDDSGSVAVADLRGNVRIVSAGWSCSGGLAWSPDGNEIWFTAARTGNMRELHAVRLSGQERSLARVAGALILQDVSHDGLALVTRDHWRNEITGVGPGESRGHDLSWLDNSGLRDISSDGGMILFDESGEGGGPRHSIYLRKLDGSAPVRLGDGLASGLSSDGKWALARTDGDKEPRLSILPTGAGMPKILPLKGMNVVGARWFADGKRLLILGNESGHGLQLFVQDVGDGSVHSVTPDGISAAPRMNPSPDGRFALARGPDGEAALFPVEGGTPIRIQLANEEPVQWSADGRAVYVFQPGEFPAKVYRVDLATGRREPWRELWPADSTGVLGIGRLFVSADGKACAFGYQRLLSNLYVVEGLK
jgi:serine/threonine protein kinase/Tol biopolymer transport system component